MKSIFNIFFFDIIKLNFVRNSIILYVILFKFCQLNRIKKHIFSKEFIVMQIMLFIYNFKVRQSILERYVYGIEMNYLYFLNNINFYIWEFYLKILSSIYHHVDVAI